jgi:hypothetical protein
MEYEKNYVIGIKCKSRLYGLKIQGCISIGYNASLKLQYVLCNYRDYSIILGFRKYNIPREDFLELPGYEIAYLKHIGRKFGIIPVIVLCADYEMPRARSVFELRDITYLIDINIFREWPYLQSEVIRLVLNKNYINSVISG